jgi:hypothetical protein
VGGGVPPPQLWKFRPSVVNGRAVPTRMVVTVTFAE